jgi:hypothetical protein
METTASSCPTEVWRRIHLRPERLLNVSRRQARLQEAEHVSDSYRTHAARHPVLLVPMIAVREGGPSSDMQRYEG